MRKIRVELADLPYDVHVGSRALALAAQHAGNSARAVVLADARVWELHGERSHLAGFPRWLTPEGERAKDFAVLGQALEFMAGARLPREGLVLALGGGATSDLAGLSAALYMRGVSWIAVPTTFVAQADAAVGGKTAVNLSRGKNLAGAFHHPRAVYADPGFLSTLGETDYRAGLGEVLKCALLGSEGLLELLEARAEPALSRDLELAGKLAAACVRLKATLVAEDPLDRGPRQALNLGHTFAHALEKCAGLGRVSHGQAVALGLQLALACSREAGLLEDPTLPERTRVLVRRLGLPASLRDVERQAGQRLETRDLLQAMELDKKAGSAGPRFVLPRAVGWVERGVELPSERVARVLENARD